MIIVLTVSLFTSRIVLQALGVSDFGLYHVVGGVVTLFAFLRTSMEKATQRFLNVEMVKSTGNTNNVFCTSLLTHLLIAASIFLLTETIGLWFLNTNIQIPEGRALAANIVYQTTIFSLCITVLTIPYSATIVANEEMGYFTIVSISDAFLKLGIAYFALITDSDRLVLYGLLMMAVTIVNLLLYTIFCHRRFRKTTRFHLLWDKSLFKEISKFVSWTFIGQISIVGCNQGNNIFVNIFHSVTANAAMSIGSQVNGAVTSLTSNFQTAFNPQITKSYAAKDYDYLNKLVCSTSKLSYLLLFIFSLPIMFNTTDILSLWLGKVPDYAETFCILFLCNGILNGLSAPLNFSIMATGRIKNFQITTSIVYLSDLLVLYILFSLGFPPTTAMYVKVSTMVVIVFIRIYYAQRETEAIEMSHYLKTVLIPLIIVSLLSVILAKLFMQIGDSMPQKTVSAGMMMVTSAIVAYFVGLSRYEKGVLKNMLTKIRRKC